MASTPPHAALDTRCANASLTAHDSNNSNHSGEDSSSFSDDSHSEPDTYYCYSDYGSETNLTCDNESTGGENGNSENGEGGSTGEGGTSDGNRAASGKGACSVAAFAKEEPASKPGFSVPVNETGTPTSVTLTTSAPYAAGGMDAVDANGEYMVLASPAMSTGAQYPHQNAQASYEKTPKRPGYMITVQRPTPPHALLNRPPPTPPRMSTDQYDGICLGRPGGKEQQPRLLKRLTVDRSTSPTCTSESRVPDNMAVGNIAKPTPRDLVNARCIFTELADTTQVIYNVLTAVMLPTELTNHLSASERTLACIVSHCIKTEWPRLTGMVFTLQPPSDANHYGHVMRVVGVANGDDNGSWGRLCITLAFVCVYAKCYMDDTRETRSQFATLLSDFYTLNRMSWLINMGGLTKGTRARFPFFWLYYKLRAMFKL